VHRYASPVRSPAAFAADLGALIQRLDPVRIIPTCEEVFHLARAAEVGGWSGRLCAPAPETLATLHAKDRFAALCGRLDLPVPETRVATDAANVTASVAALGDVVVKPVWSRFGEGARVFPTAADLTTLRPTPDRPWVVQRRIRGAEVCFYAVSQAGRVIAFAAYGSDWRLPGGASYAFRPPAPAISEALRRMADRLAVEVGTGQFACDAIVDADGRPWLIECNPRATSGVHLFGRSAAFGRALLGQGEAAPDGRSRHIAPALWLFGLPQGRWSDWRRQRREGLDALTAPGDRAPLAGALVDTLQFSLRALRQGTSLTGATTADIEWNGEPL